MRGARAVAIGIGFLMHSFSGAAQAESECAAAEAAARIPAGAYVPLYGDGSEVEVASFALNRLPVTNAEFLTFVRSRPKWRRGSAPRIFADEGYLSHWAGELDLGVGQTSPDPRAPVTQVSWFAARAYCAAFGKRLPTLDEWDSAALERIRREGTRRRARHSLSTPE